MSGMRKRHGLTLIGVMIGMIIIAGFLGTYFTLQQSIERATNEDDKSVVGQLLASEALEIVQGIKTANFLQCREAYDEFLNSGGSDPGGDTVCTDWDKGLESKMLLDSTIDLQDPDDGIPPGSINCNGSSSDGTCQLYKDGNEYVYDDSSGEKAEFRRVVEITKPDPDQLTATVYVFARDRYEENTYGTASNEPNFEASVKLFNTDLESSL